MDRMKTTSKSATIETAFGQALPEPLKFSYSFVELEKGDAVPDDEVLTEKDIRNVQNAKRNASARASATTKALEAAGIQKPTLEDPNVQFATMVKVLVAAGNTVEQAEQIAAVHIKR
jgi:hypothetical protein